MAEGEIFFVNVAEGINEKLPVQDGKFAGPVALGNFKVEIRAYREVKANTDMYGPDAPSTMENIIPAKYNTESQLTATVSKDSPAPLEFAVTSQ